jgi:hypothetical protein
MFARKGVFSSIGRAAALATVAALVLTAAEPTIAFAGPASTAALHGTSGATDISAQRRYRGGYYRGGGAAAAAAFAGIVGTGLAVIAAQNRRADYDAYGYYGGPGPGYYGGPAYYGGGPYGYYGSYGSQSQLPYVPY